MVTTAVVVLATACGGAGAGGDRDEVLVSAAASLTDAFADVEAAVEADHPELDVVLNLAGSSALREQVLQGAPADVLATADTSTMDEVVAAEATTGTPTTFASNELVIAVPQGNPASVTGLEDFAREDLLLGLCAEDVPCGDLARQALDLAGVTARPDTREPDVRALVTKVATGELDAGITYTTDVRSDDAVEAVALDEVTVRATYPVAVLADAPNPGGAAVVVDFLLGARGQSLLADHGFGAP